MPSSTQVVGCYLDSLWNTLNEAKVCFANIVLICRRWCTLWKCNAIDCLHPLWNSCFSFKRHKISLVVRCGIQTTIIFYCFSRFKSILISLQKYTETKLNDSSPQQLCYWMGVFFVTQTCLVIVIYQKISQLLFCLFCV